ncbi:acyl-CoA dehydrogenase family protein [Pusillimonas sp. ANT_WB101]|uniref:acyl-CoA dehydrogenase family protein n=1 Tax=Pusillimonas sp. ANT_WB101 TaxID=2597356 RepID=UPI00165DA5A5|nr:acyl-CoA dehydrogenase family protein [Pusillimonas sp. ANT_WB101]
MSSLDTELDETEDLIRMIDESAAHVLKDDLLRARKQRFTTPGFERAKWLEFSELGWLTLCIDEQKGGLGLGMRELCTLAHRLGQQLTPEPILASALIADVLPEAHQRDLLECKQIILPAFVTYGRPMPVFNNGKITGYIDCIPYALGADAFLVQAEGGAALVRPGEAGVSLIEHKTHDGGHFCSLRLEKVPAQWLSSDMTTIREQATLVVGAYLSGLSERAFQITQDFIKERVQFDKPIGSFQVVQHRMVDLFLELKLGRAALGAAANGFADGLRSSALELTVSLAKARLSRASSVITREAIQLHGGIGYTDEADIGLYLRKSMTMSGTFGTESFHRNRAFSLMGANHG